MDAKAPVTCPIELSSGVKWQPIVHTRNVTQVWGYEALAEHYVPDLMALHNLMLHQIWQSKWISGFASINLAPEQLELDLTYKTLVHWCQHLVKPPSEIVIEITEQPAGDAEAMWRTVRKLHAKGFRFAVDDFPVGASTPARLKRNQIEIVKLDISMLRNDIESVRKLVEQIRRSGRLVVQEGVETHDEHRFAIRCEADLVQGFLFGKPERFANLNGTGPI